MEQTNKTPAQEAKEYAAANGFTITANGRRYDVTRNGDLIANVGGYPAALNAMRNAETKQCNGDNCTSNGITPHSPECIAEHDRVTGAVEFGIPADTIVGEKPAFVLSIGQCRDVEATRREQLASLNRNGKFTVFVDGVDMGWHESYDAAVKALRRMYNAALRAGEKWGKSLIQRAGA